MDAQIIDGKSIAQKIRQALKTKVVAIQSDNKPGLAVIQVGNDAASKVYVNYKKQACVEIGFESFSYELPESISENELSELIETLNNDKKVHGILVQLPLPQHFNVNNVIAKINPEKDVDGFHVNNIGSLAINTPKLRPCTPKGIITLLNNIPNYNITGRHAVIVGASNIVGMPMSLELLAKRATVTTCHSKTQSLENHIKNADILIVAVGIPMFIPGSWIKPRAVVIDVGMNRLENGSLCGDVFFEEAVKVASYITKVPGGVGPMTIASLLENTWEAYQQQC